MGSPQVCTLPLRISRTCTMSVRQSLYGQSLVRNANTVNFGSEPQDKHWKRDWFSPVQSTNLTTSVPSTSGTPTPFGDDRETPETSQRLTFSIKAWMVDNEYYASSDCEESDFIDLVLHSTDKSSFGIAASNGLSEDAIRGAVANEDSIPGLSKSIDSPAVTDTE